MQDLLDAMKVAIFENVKRSIVRYAQIDRVEWLMHRREGEDEPSDPAQVILLILAVYYVQEVEEAFDAYESDPNALLDYNCLLYTSPSPRD